MNECEVIMRMKEVVIPRRWYCSMIFPCCHVLCLFLQQSDKDTVDAYIDLALGLNGASWSLPILRNSSATSNLDLQKSFTDALVQLKVKEISAQVTSCRRCVCVSDATGRGVKPKCDITEDQAFCRCEATGDKMVCSHLLSGTFV